MKSGNDCRENIDINICIGLLFFHWTEAKGQRRLPLPAHLVRSGEPPWCVLLYKSGPAAQTGGTWAATFSLGATWTLLGTAGEVPGSLGKETEEEWGCEPLRSIEIALTSLTFCQRSQGYISWAAWAGPGWGCVQRNYHLLWRPPAGFTVQRACQSRQD